MERPILFSADMVRAILEGRKTQTRRIVKPQPLDGLHNDSLFPRSIDSKLENWNGETIEGQSRSWKCQYGNINDVLWVKETFYELNKVHYPDLPHKILEDKVIFYAASFDRSTSALKKKPSLFMPKIASRIQLTVKSIRVERLNDISKEDAAKEGVYRQDFIETRFWNYDWKQFDFTSPIDSYRTLWEKINGKESWKSNPFVWVIDFEVSSLFDVVEHLAFRSFDYLCIVKTTQYEKNRPTHPRLPCVFPRTPIPIKKTVRPRT